jgi:hypothetical protein
LLIEPCSLGLLKSEALAGAQDQCNSQDNASYYGFGEVVLAVADAVVADIKDGIPLNVATEMPAVTTLDNIAGNYVILDLGNGHFAQYAHLQPAAFASRLARGYTLARSWHWSETAGILMGHTCISR